MLKIAIITGFLGELRDRFCVYNRPLTLPEKLRAASSTPGISGVELVYPYDFQSTSIEDVRRLLRELDLGVAAVNVNVKGEHEFAAGSLTSSDRTIRERALDFLKQGMNAAAELGSYRITVCPLSDGHDYPFQANYEGAWRLLKESIAQVAAYRPDVTVSLEYKRHEPRVFSTLGSVYQVILLIKELGLPNIGVTLDVGHSLYGGETAAEALSMLHYYDIRTYLHMNDNYRNWDWDLIPGTVNLWDLVEFLWTARRYGYDDWFTLDVFPARLDPKACFATSAKAVESIHRLASLIKEEDIEQIKRTLPPDQVVPAIFSYLWEKSGLVILRTEERDPRCQH